MKTVRTSSTRRAGAVLVLALGAASAVAIVTVAEDPIAEAAPTKPRKPARPKKDAGPAAPGSSVDASAPLASAGESSSPRATASQNDAGGGLLESRGGGDGGTKTFRFGEVEIEGRLRSPQLVYFLRRVRAEFAAGDLGHRSFMGELSQTRQESSF